MKKWYVHDKFDCYGSFVDVTEAASCAKLLADSGEVGVHIVYMTEVEAEAYCVTGNLNKSWIDC